MVKKGDNLPKKHLRQELYDSSEDFVEVFLDSRPVQNVSEGKGRASNERSKGTMSQKRECSTSPKICVAPMNLIIDDGGEMANTEYQHETDLEAIELAIANKRTELRKQRDMDHMKEKAALVAKIQELEHARLTRQHNFRVAITRKQENIERLKKEYQTGLENHCKKLEEFRSI